MYQSSHWLVGEEVVGRWKTVVGRWPWGLFAPCGVGGWVGGWLWVGEWML